MNQMCGSKLYAPKRGAPSPMPHALYFRHLVAARISSTIHTTSFNTSNSIHMQIKPNGTPETNILTRCVSHSHSPPNQKPTIDVEKFIMITAHKSRHKLCARVQQPSYFSAIRTMNVMMNTEKTHVWMAMSAISSLACTSGTVSHFNCDEVKVLLSFCGVIVCDIYFMFYFFQS